MTEPRQLHAGVTIRERRRVGHDITLVAAKELQDRVDLTLRQVGGQLERVRVELRKVREHECVEFAFETFSELDSDVFAVLASAKLSALAAVSAAVFAEVVASCLRVRPSPPPFGC